MFNIICKIERWKYNIEYGVYVSTEGRIKSKSKELIRPRTSNTGYLIVSTDKKKILVHRLVMYTWRPTENMEDLTTDHLDHNKRNNSIRNLEWVTREENVKRGKNDLEVLSNEEISILLNKIRDINRNDVLEEELYVNDCIMSYKEMINFFWESPVIQGIFKNKKALKADVIKRFQLNKQKSQRGKIKTSFFGVARVRVIND